MTKKVIIHVLGLFFLAFGVSSIVLAKLGAAPLDAVNQFISELTKGTLTLGIATFISNAIMTMIILAFTRKPKILISLVISLILSGFIDLWVYFYSFVPGDLMINVLFRIIIVIVAILVITVSTGVLIFNNLILSPYDEFVLFISNKAKSYQKGRLIVDVGFLSIAIILGFILNNLTTKLSIFNTKNVIYQQINIVTIILVLSLPVLIDAATKFVKRRIGLNEIK